MISIKQPANVGAMVLPLLMGLATVLSAQDGLLPDLDEFVTGVMAEHGVPGLALAIVKDGKVLVARGYGVKTLGEPARVDEHTLFGIASNTKAFTATALAILVEDGKLDWGDLVIEHLPWFRLSDPWVTSQMTIRDLLVHRSGLGLGAGDLLWWPASNLTRRQIAERLRFIPLSASFRSTYAYDNVLYSVAGEVIAAISGKSWEEFVKERILVPAGMTDSRIRHPGIGNEVNIASTHARVDGIIQKVAPFTSDNTNPAGGINASATDMAKWLTIQLDSGRVAGGKPLFMPATTRQLWELVTPMPPVQTAVSFAPLRTHFNGYALGFNVRDYRGEQVVTHTGGLPGFISRVTMLPSKRLGIAVLTNHESRAMEPITWTVVDHFLGQEYDWRTPYLRSLESQLAAESKSRSQEIDGVDAVPALPLGEYVGHYTDAWYGRIDIDLTGSVLRINFSHTPLLVGQMVPRNGNTFLVRWDSRELRADALITFSVNAAGGIIGAKMIPASPSVDFSFDFADLNLIKESR